MDRLVRLGASFAEAALFSGGAFPATARAAEPTLLAKVPREAFLALLRSDAELCLCMLQSLATWHHRLTFQVQQLRAEDGAGRLKQWLTEEAKKAPGGAILLRQSKKLLAAQLGMAPETLSRHLAQLKKAGLIAVEGPVIRVLGALESS
jgi:CRP-like cAMP-binding protein